MAKRKRHTAHRSYRQRSPRKSTFRRLFYFLGFTVLALVILGQYAKTHVSPNVLSESSGGGGDSHGGGGDSSGGGGSSGSSDSSGRSGGSSGGSSTQTNTQSHETETQTSGGTSVKTKVENDGRVKVESVAPGFRFKLGTEDGNPRFHMEDAQGNKLREFEQEEVENELENEGVEVSTEDGKFAITKDDVRAVSELPLSVDTSKTQILITTPNGKSHAIILPNVAIANLSRAGFLTGFASGSAETSSPSGSLTLSTNETGTPVYFVPAFRHKSFLGLFPVDIPLTTEVSAETGALVGSHESFFSQLLGVLSL